LKPIGLREAAILALILAVTATIGGLTLIAGIPDPPCPGAPRIGRTFTIIADLNGYNGSKLQGGSGPYMTASRCDIITINLVNRDLQSHGLSVTFYALNGIEAIGGDTVSVTFLAVESGVFRVYCNTQCSVHFYMQHAALTIT
jgi:hypothetical protein